MMEETLQALANWREPAEYPPVGPTLLPRWHWEFLRRNPQYQADFDRYTELGPAGADADLRETLARKYGLNGIMLDYRESLEMLFQSPRRNQDVKVIRWQTAWVGEDEKGRLIEGVREDFSYLDPCIRQHECCVVFNMRESLDEQMEAATARLRQVQQRFAEKRGDVNNYPLYLRLIDAGDAGASDDEVAGVLYPEAEVRLAVKRIRTERKEAMRLRDVDYQYI